MNSPNHRNRRSFPTSSSILPENVSNPPVDMLLALDRMVVEVSMQLYNLNRSERSRMRRQNRRLHAAVREHLPRLLQRARAKS
jgi:hypothetical protein